MNNWTLLITIVLTGLFSSFSYAAGGHSSDSPLTLFAILGIILILAKLAGGFSQKIGIPSVLAELLVGILLGNAAVLVPMLTPFIGLKDSVVIKGLAELGVIFLLFLVGLETDIHSLRTVGKEAAWVAIIGVTAPLLFAVICISPVIEMEFSRLLFLGAALAATSVGISVRVLQDLKTLTTKTGQVILGAAVIDDILGIFMLSLVVAFATKGQIVIGEMVWLLTKLILFCLAIVILRRFIFKKIFAWLRLIEVPGMMIVCAVSLCLIFAWLAEAIGLAAILGAFALGIALDDIYFKGYNDAEHTTLEHMMKPITNFLVPVFFVAMGMSVDLKALMNPQALLLAGILCLAAILGKLICGIVIKDKAVDKWQIGFGMMPRGEVGLIFAVIGIHSGVLTEVDYSALVFMVMLTTLLSPWLLARRIRKQKTSA